MKNLITVVSVSALLLALQGCDNSSSSVLADTTDSGSETLSTSGNSTAATTDGADDSSGEITVTEQGEASDYSWDSDDEVLITFDGDSITLTGDGVTVNDQQVVISAAGSYRLQGTLDDGQVVVDSGDEGVVRLILDDVALSSSNNSPLYIANAARTILIAPAGTENVIIDASDYVYDSTDTDEPDAAIFADDDLTIYGPGLLTVYGNYNDAIMGKDGLLIKNANLIVNATADDGIRGKDYLQIEDSTVTVISAGDGLKSDNDEDQSLGYISISRSTCTITATTDGIQAETDALISDSSVITLTTGGGSSTTAGDDSAKGIKADGALIIADSTVTIDAADDGLHAGALLHVKSGTLDIASGDDALHADYDLTIDDGKILVTTSYEAIEAGNITINGGDIDVTSSDDGINGASDEVTSPYLEINGGYIRVNAEGDGIDVNGSILVSDGTILVHGPTGSGNAALDYDVRFIMNGGLLIAAGSAGMATTIGSSSGQNGGLINFSSSYSAGTLVSLQGSDGNELFTFAPEKTWRSLAFSSPDLTLGSSWTIYTGGTHSGTPAGGLYSDGSYSPGTLYGSYTQSSTVTTQGTSR